MNKGRRLRQWANRVCSAETMDRLIDPVIADLQHEYERAKAARRGIALPLLRGYCAFWKVLTVHVPATWLNRTATEFRASHGEAFVPAIVAATITMVVACATLIVEPARRNIDQHHALGVWLAILLLPQAIPFGIPLSLFTGIAYGWRRRPVTTQVRRFVIILGLAGTVVSASTIIWVVPIANQTFRTTIAGRVLVEGPGEMSPREVRENALAWRDRGQMAKAGDLLFSFHARWALAGAALVFAVFGLGVIALRLGRIATVLIAATAFVVYVTYFPRLAQARSVFSHEGLAVTFAWLPNALILLTSIAFLTKRDDQTLAESRRTL